MQPEVTLAVLTELGVLFQAPNAEFDEPQQASSPPPQDHVFLDHPPLWEHESTLYLHPYADAGAPLLRHTLPAGTSIAEALAHTRLIIFLGAANTPTLRSALAAPGTLLLIFDDSPKRVAAMGQDIGPENLVGHAHIFLGKLDRFVPPLGMVLPATLFDAGFPVFFALDPQQHGGENGLTMDNAVRLLEVLHYRHKLYPISGQANNRGLPLRTMQRGLFYDQQMHAYQNAADFFIRPDISPLRRAFQGETAILVAAGPDLPEHIEFLRAMRPKAVIIAVNNALKPLLAAGVHPHFVVANDTSVATAQSWEGLPRLADVALVAHCLTELGRDVFPTTFLFGTYRPEQFGQRPSLRLHGSVITTAFSLAQHMGVAQCILVGVQLCSPSPWQMIYSKGSIHGARSLAPSQPLTNAYPQLVPVINALGQLRYTTPNFLDACQWFLEEIRSSGIPCVNITDQTLVLGPGVRYDPTPVVEATGRLERRLRQISSMRPAHQAHRPGPAYSAGGAGLLEQRGPGCGPAYGQQRARVCAQGHDNAGAF